jgi:hypothetical protein
MIITANKLSWTDSKGNTIEVALTEEPRKVRRGATGPAYRVRGISCFVSGPCFAKYGAHPEAVDFGLSEADALAWHMSRI